MIKDDNKPSRSIALSHKFTKLSQTSKSEVKGGFMDIKNWMLLPPLPNQTQSLRFVDGGVVGC